MTLTRHASRALAIGRAVSTWLRTASRDVPHECRAAYRAGLEASDAFDQGYRSGFSAGRADGFRAGHEQGVYDARIAAQMAEVHHSLPGRLVECTVFDRFDNPIGAFDADGAYTPIPRPAPVLRREQVAGVDSQLNHA